MFPSARVKRQMSIWRPLRETYIRSTDLTHAFQGEPRERIQSFYRLWSFCYDFSVGLDPAYRRELKRMVNSVVNAGDIVLDIGCGTGLGTIHAARAASKVVGIDISPHMIGRLRRNAARKGIDNIEVVLGGFPAALAAKPAFDSAISSFAIVHFPAVRRREVYENVFRRLVNGGRVGLFSARGEVAAAFETRDEITGNLEAAGFQRVDVADVADIYRIVRAEKP